MGEASLQGKLVGNQVPNDVDFGRNPYYEDRDVFDVFTDMLITKDKSLYGPTGVKEDMTLTAVCSLWRTDAAGGPPHPCGPPLYVGPVGQYPAGDGGVDSEAWKEAQRRNPNAQRSMRSTAVEGDAKGLGGAVCHVPIAYRLQAQAPPGVGGAAWETLWRSLVSIGEDGGITVSSLQRDVCLPATNTTLHPMLLRGFKLIVTPHLWQPIDPPPDYELRATRALPPVELEVSWTWISYTPTLLTAVLGGGGRGRSDEYYMTPFVSPSLSEFRDPAIRRRVDAAKNAGKTPFSPYVYGSGYAHGYSLRYRVEPDAGGAWPHPVRVDQETGVVVVSAPKEKGHSTQTRAKGRLTVELASEAATAGAGGLTAAMGFPRSFPIEIEWLTAEQWYRGVNQDAARGAGNPAPSSRLPAASTGSVDTTPDAKSGGAGGCAQPQPPLGIPNKYSTAVANRFSRLGDPSCYTFQAQAGGQAGFGLASGAASVTMSAGCEQLVAQMSNYNSFSQSLSCQFNSVGSQGSAFASAYSSISVSAGRDIAAEGYGLIDISSDQVQQVKMKASLRSVNQQTLAASTASAIKSTAKSKIKWANGSGAAPHGSKSIKQLTQNANSVTSAQSINKVMQSSFGGIYANSKITVDAGRDIVAKERGRILISSKQQQELVVSTFCQSAMGSSVSSVMTNAVTDGMDSSVVDQSKGPFEGVSGMVEASQAGLKWIVVGLVILGVVGAIVGGIVAYKKFGAKKKGKAAELVA